MTTECSMKPIVILPPNEMSPEDIAELKGNGLCVVVAEHPSAVKFLDPIPAAKDRTHMENACIALSRLCVNGTWTGPNVLSKSDLRSLWIDCLIEGTPLDRNGTAQEQEKRTFDHAKAEEVRKIAREEARAEAAAKKAAKVQPPKK